MNNQTHDEASKIRVMKRTAESKVRTNSEKWEVSRINLNILLFKRLPCKVANLPWKGVFKVKCVYLWVL